MRFLVVPFVRPAVLGVLLAGLLTWLMSNGFDAPVTGALEARRAIDAVALAESRLDAEILRVRGGLVPGDGQLDARADALMTALAALLAVCRSDPEARAVASKVADRVAMVEAFGGDVEPVRASLEFFDTLSDRLDQLDPGLAHTLATLPNDAAALARDTSQPRLTEFGRELDAIAASAAPSPALAAEIARVVSHGRTLLDRLPKVDAVSRGLHETSSESARADLVASQQRRYAERQDQADRYQVALYAASLSLLALLGVRTRAAAVNLRKTIRLQAEIARASGLFLASQPDEASDRLVDVMAAIGEAAGSEHGYVLELGPPGTTHLWTRSGLRPPTGWPTMHRAMIPDILAAPDDTITIETAASRGPAALRDRLAARGVRSWACMRLRRDDRVVAILCFECSATATPPWLRQSHGMLPVIGGIFAAALERQAISRRHRETEAALRRAHRLEAIGTFTSGVAHNINNVLNVMLGHAEIAAGTLPRDTRAARQIDLLLQAGGRAREITSQILDFGRRGASTHHASAIDAVVAETVSQIRTSMVERLSIHVDGTAEGALVAAEAAQLQQVIHNLIRNAAEASEPDASVSVHLALIGVTGLRKLSHGTLRPGPYARLSVADVGHGMDEATRARIFEPFFTTRPTGTGLGLATAFEFVEERGGAFEVRSAVGQGSTFEVWLPVVASAEAPPGAAATGGALMVVGRSQSALLEDEEILAALGFEPVGFASPNVALAILEQSPERFDLLIVESRLPRSTGLDFARSAMHLARVPVILSLTAVETVEADAATAAGVVDVVRRPWRSDTLAATLSRHVGVSDNALPTQVRLAGGSVATRVHGTMAGPSSRDPRRVRDREGTFPIEVGAGPA